ncbi:MAG: hypothetical protein ACE5HL_07285 [Terriglobia bacterium]
MFATMVFALTLVMIGVHVGEWFLLGQLARASQQRPLRRSPFTRALGLMNFLRFEAFYYAVLLGFWLLADGAVPGAAVFVLGVIHLGGWAAIEGKKSMPQLEAIAIIAAHNPEAEAGGTRLRRLLKGIAAFDAAEVLVLGYLAYRLWPLA